ncbi:hypothetical protein NQ314_004346 [Rhamnusium bicolor]|uniref:Tudor domain-containing protein n=1 Tax=Rhamnusium bicolor TaxID=1586634 RepID=A0AAV8ZMG4_9CUCU|nr:hypothetical protein NQ314_004346 [Rhamnusium bicolor]
MDRRKSKIFIHYDEIIDEKCTLQENLEKIINQVFSCVGYVKNSYDEIKQKDCCLILKHQLEVLKKLTEINYELENIIEQSPLELLHIDEKKYEIGMKVPQLERNVSEIKSVMLEASNLVVKEETQEATESSTDTEFNSVACTSAYISELISGNQNVETESNVSNDDIQTLRETLKKFSEKLGLNAECISSIKDYYEKPSTSCMKEYFEKPSSSVQDVCIDNDNMSSTNFDISEKDTNVICSEPEVKQSSINDYLPVESVSNSSNSSEHNLNENSIDICLPKDPVSQKNYCADDSSLSTDAEILNASNTIDSISEEETCLAEDDENKHNDLISNTVDHVANKTEDSSWASGKIVYTALEKLNNTKIFDRREEALSKLLSVDLPDIKLKPTESMGTSVIKNNFEADNNNRKKKNKKKKSGDKDNVFYELKWKPVPTVGTFCAFSHVESPNEFYIHVADEESELIDTLNDQINEYFMESVSEYTSKEEASSKIGTYCFAFIDQYSGWYRAKILEWQLDSKSNEVLLRLVDYGNKRRVSYGNLRKMTKELSDIPMLAIRCHLPLMYPPGSTFLNRLTEWPSETIDAILDLSGLFHTETGSNKLFKIVFAHEEGDSVAIDLYNPQEANEEDTVGQILLDLGVAVQILENYDEEQLDLEVYLQDIDSLERAENINEAVIGYDPRDEARICRFTKKRRIMLQRKTLQTRSCSFIQRRISIQNIFLDGFTTDTLPVFKEAMYGLTLPAHDEVIRLLITGYKDTCNFFVQIVRTDHYDQKNIIDKDLYMLLGDMNYARTVSTYETFKIPPAIGEIVIVKHWSKKWLRAVAVECYIHNYKAKKDCDPQKAKKFFYQNLYFKNFVAVAMSTALPLKIGIKTFNDIDVGKTLEENGFAEERICDKNPIDGCPLELY